METIIKIELFSDHRTDLIKKTKKFIYYWYKSISEINPIMVDIFIRNAGRNIKTARHEDFDRFVDSIFKKCPQQYIERQTVEKECISYLDHIVMQGIEFENSIDIEISSLIRRLEKLIGEWHVVIPIDNLILEGIDEFKIGSVNIYNPTKMYEILNSITDIDLKQFREINIVKDKDNAVWAEITVIIEDGRQFQEALVKIESTINLLRIYLDLLDSSFFKRAKIGVSEGFSSVRIMLSYKKQTISLRGKFEKIRINLPFTLTEKHIEILYQHYPLSEIDSILCKTESSRSDIEKRLLIAIRWIGSGIHEDLSCDKLLDFAIALDCMLGKKEESISITESLAERCAFLLDNDNPDCRYLNYKNVKKLYDLRSKIVHEGKTNIDNEYVDIFKSIALGCFLEILYLIKEKEIKEIDDLVKWINKKKMGCYYPGSQCN